MKLNDVYRFQYHPKEGDRDRYWCFDGQLIVRARQDGTLFLEDTYWGYKLRGDNNNRVFSPEEAAERGELTFVCNLDEVEEIPDGLHYYADEDVFNLSHQHGCYKLFMRRKGAQRSREAMLRYLHSKREEAKRQMASAVSSVEWLSREIYRVESAEALDKLCI